MIRASLAELDLGELLKALSVGRKSAVVSFQGRIYGRVHLYGGRILYVRTEPGPHLGEYLVRLGHLTLEEVQTLVERQGRENPGTPLGALALELGLIGEEELLEALKAQVLEALATLLGEKEGEILAEPLDEGSQVALPQTLDTDWALMEAARLLDEWRRGQVDPDEVLHLAEDPTRHPLSPEAWAVLELLDGVRRARSVALLSGLPEEGVYHLLHELKSRGLVRPSTLLAEDPPGSGPGGKRRGQAASPLPFGGPPLPGPSGQGPGGPPPAPEGAAQGGHPPRGKGPGGGQEGAGHPRGETGLHLPGERHPARPPRQAPSAPPPAQAPQGPGGA
jgi:hypothetical protein